MSPAALFAGGYTLAAGVVITLGAGGQVRPLIAWPAALGLTIAARAAMRIVHLETAGRFRP